MAQRRSALADFSAAPNGSGTGLGLSEHRVGSILQIAAWPETLARVEDAIAAFLGVEIPKMGFAATAGDISVLAIGPGRFLVAGDAADLATGFAAALSSSDAVVTDLSHGRAVLRLDGEASSAVLAKGVAVDLHLAVFPPGRIAQTMIHYVDVTIHRRGADQFDLWVLRGFAEDFAEWLMDAGLEFGIGFVRT